MIQIDAGSFFLVEPSERYTEQISEYRQVFLGTNGPINGCGPLQNYEDPIAYIA